MCGIVGIKSNRNIKKELFSILYSLKHRGEDSWGVSFYQNDTINMYKKLGSIKKESIDLITQKNIFLGIGHTRYKTQGSSSYNDTQPILIENPFKISMVHNGNITNSLELAKDLNLTLKTTNDIEIILSLFIKELTKNNVNNKNISIKNIFNTVKELQKKLEGAYSVLALLDNGILAFKDPYGVRPLILAKKDDSYLFASEFNKLKKLGYSIIKELKSGEAIFIDKFNQLHSQILNSQDDKFCVFEYIYFSKPETSLYGKIVSKERIKMGKEVAEIFRKKNLNVDFVVPIPETANFAAEGFAKLLNLPIKNVFIKKDVGRSFIQNNHKNRVDKIRSKFDFNLSMVKDKNIVLIDDSIVRGNTTKYLVSLLKKAGVNKIYLVSASPMIKSQCFYGIDISTKEELLSNNRTLKEIQNFIGVDELIYLPLDSLKNIYKDLGICSSCFR